MSAIPVVQIVGNSDGGGTRFVVDIMRRLDSSQFHFTLISPHSDWLADACAHIGATFRPLPLMSSRRSAALSREFRSIVANAAPMIVHAHGSRAAWLATRSLSRDASAPALIYSEHLFSMDARRGLFKVPWYAIERAICRRADFITTGCDANADRAVRYGWATEDRIAVRRYGIDQAAISAQAAQRLTRAELGLPSGTLLVGTVGRLIPQKGFTYLLHAMKRVIAQHPRAHCLIIGDGPLRGTLEEEGRKLGIAEQVRFLGAQSSPWSTLASCDVIALPSLFEGLWLALIEALSLGLPVVATNTGGATEALATGRNGLLVPTRDATALAAGLIRLLDDPALQEAFRAAGPRSVADYDLGPVMANIGAMYLRAAQMTARADLSA
jgi:glycosyltransferase involved in cell wall biosynthesis